MKIWRDRASAAWIQRFHSFTADDLLRALRHLGIQRGDIVIAHTSFARFQGFRGGIGDAIQVLQQAVGEEGALLVPTLPFSGSAVDYARSSQITDLAKTASRMGLIIEIFRRLPGVTRSIHPTHPVAGWGKRATELLRDHYLALSPCGQGSPFHRLLEVNGKILLAGTGIQSMTFYHCLEEILEPQMPVSPLTKEMFHLQTRAADGQMYTTHTRLFVPEVSQRRDVELMIEPLRRRGYWRETKVGLLPLIVLHVREVHDTVKEMAQEKLYCYR